MMYQYVHLVITQTSLPTDILVSVAAGGETATLATDQHRVTFIDQGQVPFTNELYYRWGQTRLISKGAAVR
jgi:hypothetical protein